MLILLLHVLFTLTCFIFFNLFYFQTLQYCIGFSIYLNKSATGILNSLLDSVVEGKGRMIWENGIETCKLSHVK